MLPKNQLKTDQTAKRVKVVPSKYMQILKKMIEADNFSNEQVCFPEF